MSRVKDPEPSRFACAGMLAGLLLLGFAGTLLVMSPSVSEIQNHVTSLSRRLQTVVAVPEGVDPLLTMPEKVKKPLDRYEDRMKRGSSDGSADSLDISGSGSSVRSSGSDWMPSGIEGVGGSWFALGGANLFHLAVMMIFAVIYYHNAVAPIIMTKGTLATRGFTYTGKDDFDNGIFSCCDDGWVLLHSCCCPLVRMSHTNAIAGVMGYWESALLWCCCVTFTGGFGPCCLMVYWRKQLKDIMGLEDHLLHDICITFFCWPLAIIQQGIAVDHASGYEVTGCCHLEWSGHHQP